MEAGNQKLASESKPKVSWYDIIEGDKYEETRFVKAPRKNKRRTRGKRTWKPDTRRTISSHEYPPL